MVDELRKRFMLSGEFSRLEIRIGDVIKSTLPSFDVCVANLPYQVSIAIEMIIFPLAILMTQSLPDDCLSSFVSNECYDIGLKFQSTSIFIN